MTGTEKNRRQLLKEISDLRTRLAESLQESEQKFRLAFENTVDAIFWADPKTGLIINCNKAAETLLEKKKKDIIGQHQRMLHPPQTAKHYESLFKKHVKLGGVFSDDAEVITKSGGIKPVSITTSLTQIGGQVVMQGIFRDITEHKQAQDKIRLHSEIIANMAEGVYLVRASDGIIAYTNPKFAEMFGYGPEEMVGKHISIVNAPTEKSPEETAREIMALLRQNGVWRGEVKNIKKDGTPFWCYANVSAFDHPEHGEVWVSIHTDITERKTMEKGLEYRRKFENLITDISMHFINLPTDKTDEGINQALEVLGQFVNVDRSYIFQFYNNGANLNNTHEWCAENIEPQIQNLQNLSADATPWWMEKLGRFENIYIPNVENLPDEAKPEKKILQAQSIKSLIAVPMLYDRHLIGFMGFDSVRKQRTWTRESTILLKIIAEIFVNTLMRKRTEEELNEYHEKMFHAEQLASLGTISATIAHELNQPLTVIQLFLQQALRNINKAGQNKDKAAENITDSLSEIAKTVSIVDRFRQFARKSSPLDIKRADLAEIARRTIKVLAESARRKKLKLLLKVENEPLNILGNIVEFEQMFFVLIENAVQAADGKTWRDLSIDASSRGGQIRLVIADTCGGVKQEILPKIFEPFFTTKPAEVGTGLGLCILDRVIKKYNGTIQVKNQPGRGLAYHIMLPAKN